MCKILAAQILLFQRRGDCQNDVWLTRFAYRDPPIYEYNHFNHTFLCVK